MSVTVRIPTPLRKFTAGLEQVDVEAQNVRAMLDALEAAHPGIRERLCDSDGKVRRFVNVFVNGEDIRFASSLDTVLESGDDVTIVPAIAGGR